MGTLFTLFIGAKNERNYVNKSAVFHKLWEVFRLLVAAFAPVIAKCIAAPDHIKTGQIGVWHHHGTFRPRQTLARTLHLVDRRVHVGQINRVGHAAFDLDTIKDVVLDFERPTVNANQTTFCIRGLFIDAIIRPRDQQGWHHKKGGRDMGKTKAHPALTMTRNSCCVQ